MAKLGHGSAIDVSGTERQILHDKAQAGDIKESNGVASARHPDYDNGDGTHDLDAFLGDYDTSGQEGEWALWFPQGTYLSTADFANARWSASYRGAGRVHTELRNSGTQLRWYNTHDALVQGLTCVVETNRPTIDGCQRTTFVDVGFVTEASDERGLKIEGGADQVSLIGCEIEGTASGDTNIVIASGVTDVEFWNCSVNGTAFDNGTRTKWDGVIAGGPLGGTDIGALTGASEGDVARADGTTGDADALYVLKASGDWQALHDPTVTITPA